MSERPFLQTQRLELWKPQARDMHELVALTRHEETARFIGGPKAYAEDVTRFMRHAGSWMLFGYGSLMLRERGSSDILGTLAIFYSWRDLGKDMDGLPEAGWILRHDTAGKGYAHEAMSAIFNWFDEEHGLPLNCMIDSNNFASIKLAGKLGFKPMREAQLPDGARTQLFHREAKRKN
ncbi:GNAT family N-acetyltransferase [Altererythrobacter indicus]|uniref:GNAT family N-acetyltransferase n=1 Tax=Altericroceibacterium indicum TaxID=374177 RepID=A0A845AC18_9SPHN|nr:GNAT family N-acetyltransferase [Altericroceibacterium indicum]MXP26541.1 GNAT family N-acetyltransferase [Altericroceibacterium indicum]